MDTPLPKKEEKMSQATYKFFTTLSILVIMVIGVFLAAQFKDAVNIINTSLLLVNALLLLMIVTILLSSRVNVSGKTKNRGDM